MAGRPRKSDTEKRATGTLQPCRSSSKESVIASNFALTETPPVGLTKEARAAWKMAIACAPKGLLTATDLSVLERWARNYALYRKISKQLDNEGLCITIYGKEGQESLAVNPLFTMSMKLQQVLSLCEKELGFTPVSRARVKVEQEEEAENEFDGF